MLEREFADAWGVFSGTYNCGAHRMAAYQSVLRLQDGSAWGRVARFYAEHAVTGDECPTPSEVSDAVAREASNATMQDEHCPFCDYGQIMLWRLTVEGQNFYLPHDCNRSEVERVVSPPVKTWTAMKTTASCECRRGRSLRAAQQAAKRPALRPFLDLVGESPRSGRETPWTGLGQIEGAIREVIGGGA
jgi:transposase-like protein